MWTAGASQAACESVASTEKALAFAMSDGKAQALINITGAVSAPYSGLYRINVSIRLVSFLCVLQENNQSTGKEPEVR